MECRKKRPQSFLTERPHKHGSGVGLVNVHSRLKLRFGEAYGLVIHSCPDEGMMVQIHIPYIPYTVETQKFLESGKDYSSVSASGKEGSE